MGGINLLPPQYRETLKQERHEKMALIGLGGIYLLSLFVMLFPYRSLQMKQEALKAVTYQLQDTRFEEVKELASRKQTLEEAVRQGEAQLGRLSARELPIEEMLYNMLYGLPEGMALSLVSFERDSCSLILEGTSRIETDITNRLKRIKSIYPQGKVDFVVEELGEMGYLFQISLRLEGVMTDGED